MRVLPMFAVVVLFIASGSYGGEAEIADAIERSQRYAIDADLSFDKYLVDMKVIADSSPDSPLVLAGDVKIPICQQYTVNQTWPAVNNGQCPTQCNPSLGGCLTIEF